ncbi:MAG: hypothetical protein ACFBSD_08910 [Paracoccaceae bacterium]
MSAGRFRRGLRHLSRSGWPVALPASPTASAAQIRLKRAARAAILARWPWPLRPIAAFAMALAWPVGAYRAARAAQHLALRPTKPGLAGRAFRAALRHNIAPWDYVVCGMDGSDAPSEAWLGSVELPALAARLAPRAAEALIADKEAFARLMAAEGLPHPQTLEAGAPWPPVDLIEKPRRGARAEGLRRLVWRGDRHWPGPMGGLLQPFVPPDPRIASGGLGPPVVRAISVCPPGRAPRVALALVQLPPAGRIASQGGPFRLIDPETGRIARAGPGQPPETVAPLETGALLPDWARLLEAVRVAHAMLPGPPGLLGFDIALGPEGPQILEANLGVAVAPWQWSLQTPAWDALGEDLARCLAAPGRGAQMPAPRAPHQEPRPPPEPRPRPEFRP